MIVLDANIFAKLFITEPDTDQALSLIKAIQSHMTSVKLPGLFIYEVMQIGRYHQVHVDKVSALLKTQMLDYWEIINPSQYHWQTAQRISQTGHEKSGYPTMYDSIYHAIALEEKGVFITADKKHLEKAKTFGHAIALSEWQTLF